MPMHLERMRAEGFTASILEIFRHEREHKKEVGAGDQHLLNYFLHFHPGNYLQ
jgi:lipopolysaccharide biosynthesis glycosyltransferase